MQTTATMNAPALLQPSLVPRYDAMFKDLNHRIAEYKDKITAAGSSDQIQAVVPPSIPPQIPNHDTIVTSIRTKNVGPWGLLIWQRQEAIFLVEAILAKLAVQTGYVRFVSSDEALKLQTFEQTRSHLAAYSQALASYSQANHSDSPDLTASLTFEDHLDGRLLQIAESTVAADVYEMQLADYERSIPSSDISGMLAVSACLDELLRLRGSELQKTMALLSEMVPKILADTPREEMRYSYRRSRGTKLELQRLIRKIVVAVTGGLSLLVPVVIMILHPGLLAVLLTTSAFVLLVAVLLAAAMREAEAKDIVAATAGYAAVLVVFVGTTVERTAGVNIDVSELGWVATAFIGGLIIVGVTVSALWAVLARKFPRWVILPVAGGKDYQKHWLDRNRQKA